MFIGTNDREIGEIPLSSDKQVDPVKPWVLLLQVRDTSGTCVPNGIHCMEEEHFLGLSKVLEELPYILKEKFLNALETKKPQALKIGKEADMKIYAQSVQEIICTCAFRVTAVRSL